MKENTLYSILGIKADVSESDIRKAYGRKIREFPPEKHPEEFKKIREAYETLSNPKTRKEYDTMAEYGEEINHFLEKGLQLMDEENFVEAANTFKRVLVIEPSLNYARNFYALALAYQGVAEKEKAIVQFKKLNEQEPDNATYFFNLGQTLRHLERYEEALRATQKAYQIDSDNVDVLFAVSDVFVDLENYESAKSIIESSVKKLETSDFRGFIYLFKLLQIDMYNQNYSNLMSTFNRLETLLSHNEEEKPYVAQRFAELAFKLLNYKQFDHAFYLSERATALDPTDDNIQKLHEDVVMRKPLYAEFNELELDNDISDFVKRILLLDLFGDEVSDEEFEEFTEDAIQNLSKAAQYVPADIVKSIRKVIRNYSNLYIWRKDLFDNALDLAKYYESVSIQYEQLQNDSSITHALKRLVSLYLSDDMSEEERNYYFQDIMDEMDAVPLSNTQYSLQRLKDQYPALHKLNSDFFIELMQNINRLQQSQPSRVTQASNNNSDSSCFVATAAYGTPLTEELDFLRLWRDRVLRKSKSGLKFIKLYYRYGPCLAAVVKKYEPLRSLVRKFVYKLIPYLENRYNLSEELKSKR